MSDFHKSKTLIKNISVMETYYSPEKLMIVESKLNAIEMEEKLNKIDEYKADVFSLGLVFLNLVAPETF